MTFGIVGSLNQPGGNITGITLIGAQTIAKRMELLLELVPSAPVVGILTNPKNPISKPQVTELETAAKSLGRKIDVLNASTEIDIERAFVALDERRVEALVITADPFFDDRRDEIIALAARYTVPTMYPLSQYVAAGGLMSYGANLRDAFRQTGVYVGRILKGAKPADLPVLQPTKVEFVLNLKTAKALGLTVAPTLVALTDEVIE